MTETQQFKLVVLFPTANPPQKGRLAPQEGPHGPMDFSVPSISTKEIICSLPNGLTLAVVALGLGKPAINADTFESFVGLSNGTKQSLFGGNQPFWACSYPDSFGTDYKTQVNVGSALGESRDSQSAQMANAIFGQLLRDEAERIGTKEDLSQNPARLAEFLNEWSIVKGKRGSLSSLLAKSPAAVCYYALLVATAPLPKHFLPILMDAPVQMGQWVQEFMTRASPSFPQKLSPKLYNGFVYLIESSFQNGFGRLLLGFGNIPHDFLETEQPEQLKKKIRNFLGAPYYKISLENNRAVQETVAQMVQEKSITKELLSFIMLKSRWISHETKKVLARQYNQSIPMNRRVFYDESKECNVIPMERIFDGLGGIMAKSLKEGFQYIFDNLDISEQIYSALRQPILRGFFSMNDNKEHPGFLDITGNSEIMNLIRNSRAISDNGFKSVLKSALVTWASSKFEYEQVDQFRATARNLFEDGPSALGVSRSGRFNFDDMHSIFEHLIDQIEPHDKFYLDNRCGMDDLPSHKENPTPTGGLGVLLMLLLAFPSKSKEIDALFTRLYQEPDKGSFSVSFPFWNVAFDGNTPVQTEILRKHLSVLAKFSLPDYSVRDGYLLIRKLHPAIQDTIFRLYLTQFTPYFSRELEGANSFFAYLLLLTSFQRTSDGREKFERRVALEVFQEQYMIEKTSNGLAVARKIYENKKVEFPFFAKEGRDQLLYRNREYDWAKVAYKLTKLKAKEGLVFPPSLETVLEEITRSILVLFENLDKSDLAQLETCRVPGASCDFFTNVKRDQYAIESTLNFEQIEDDLEESRLWSNREALEALRRSRPDQKKLKRLREEEKRREKEKRRKAPLFYLSRVLELVHKRDAQKLIDGARKKK